MREIKQHKIEVHVAGICFNEKQEVLILKRSQSRKLYPGLWECGGGQVKTGENFKEAIIRQLKEEAGAIIKPIKPISVYEINTPDNQQRKIPGLVFACKLLGYINDHKPQISEEHDEWQWQSVADLDNFKFIPGVREDIKKAHALLQNTFTLPSHTFRIIRNLLRELSKNQ